jgi:tetratricopeptide (TPR) repeat protein
MPIVLTVLVTSSTEEWGKSGRILFTQKLYVQAIFCFDKAEMPLEKAISEAYLLRHQARVTARRAHISGGPDPRQEAFKEAGDAFIKCAELAARSQSLTCFARAGDCFVDAGNHSRAGDSYRKAQRYELAAVHYRTAADFDASVEVIKLHASEIDATIRESILNVARLFYLQKQQLTFVLLLQ